MRFAKPKPAPASTPEASAPTPPIGHRNIDGGGSVDSGPEPTAQAEQEPVRKRYRARHKPENYGSYHLHISDLTSKAGWNDHTYLGHAVRFIDSLNLTERFKTYMDKIAQAEANAADD